MLDLLVYIYAIGGLFLSALATLVVSALITGSILLLMDVVFKSNKGRRICRQVLNYFKD